MRLFRNKLVLSCITCFMLSIVSIQAETVYDKILQNIYNRTTADYNPVSVSNWSNSFMAVQNADGSFQDINYDDTSQTNWLVATHYARVLQMSVAYVAEGSPLKGNENLYNAIVKATQYFCVKKPTSTNWWYQSIGWPQSMGLAMCMMRFGEKKVPAATEQALYDFMKSVSRDPSVETGANKQDVALHWIYFHTLTQNKTQLDYGVAQFNEPMTFTTAEGLQHDYSYQQHNNQLYTSGYGSSVLTAYFKAAYYLKGTEYDSAESTGVMSGFVRLGYMPLQRGSYTLWNTGGRGHLGRIGALYNAGFAGYLLKMAELDTDYSDYYHKAAERTSGQKPADYAVEPMHIHYWRSDYSVHLRPGYTIDFRGTSTRTCRSENGNGENLKGYFCAEGGTEITVDGNEYYNIFPTWDWALIPGTTTPHFTTMPNAGTWGKYGTSTFTGGVSNGLYGCSTYHFNDQERNVNTAAYKSWFCFDNEVVCLGANINSTCTFPVNTTINQCLLTSNVEVEDAEGNNKTLQRGEYEFNNLRWINQGKVSYYFPNNADMVVRNDKQYGSWNSVSTAIADTTTQKNDVFLSYVKHGLSPKNAKYAYVIVPNTTSISEGKSNLDDLDIINNDTIQAVYNKKLGNLQIIFHDKYEFTLGDIRIEPDYPCAMMITGIGTADCKAYISDPSYSLSNNKVIMFIPGIHSKTWNVTYPMEAGYQGKTVECAVDTLEDYNYIVVNKISPIKEHLTLDFESPTMKNNIEILPDDATKPVIKYTSDNTDIAVIAPDGTIIAVRPGTTTIHAKAIDGPETQFNVTVSNNLWSVEPEMDTYVNSKNTTTKYGAEDVLKLRNDGSGTVEEIFVRFPTNYLDSFDISNRNVSIKVMMSCLWADELANQENITAYPCTSATWKETSMTWTSKLSHASKLQFKVKGPKASEDYTIENLLIGDVTDYTLSRYNSGYKTLTLHFQEDAYNTKKQGEAIYGSKENEDISVRPRLYFYISGNPTGVKDVKTTQNSLCVENNLVKSSKQQSIEIYTADGKLVLTGIVNENRSLSIKNLEPGIYIVKGDSDEIKIKM